MWPIRRIFCAHIINKTIKRVFSMNVKMPSPLPSTFKSRLVMFVQFYYRAHIFWCVPRIPFPVSMVCLNCAESEEQRG